MDIFMNAACVAYVYANNFTLTQVYTTKSTETSREISSIRHEDDEITREKLIDKGIKSKSDAEWFTLIKSMQNQMPAPGKMFVRHVISIIGSHLLFSDNRNLEYTKQMRERKP